MALPSLPPAIRAAWPSDRQTVHSRRPRARASCSHTHTHPRTTMARRSRMTPGQLQMKTLVVTLLAMLAATYVHSGGNPDRHSGRRLCGQQLADTLDMVCGQTGFNWRKRSEVYFLWFAADDTKAAGRERRSLMAGVRQGRSVADECCRQGPCTIQILESYCASPVEGASENMRSYLISMLNGPQMASTTTTPETTATTARPGSNSPAAEVFRGPSWRNSSNFKQFFYLPVNSRPTRSPLIFK